MITYVGLVNFTDKGIAGIKDTTKRAAAAKEVAGRFGVTAFNLALATQGNVRTQSLRAFNATEMEQVLAKLP